MDASWILSPQQELPKLALTGTKLSHNGNEIIPQQELPIYLLKCKVSEFPSWLSGNKSD